MNQSFAAWPHVVEHLWKLNLQAALLAAIVGVVCLIGRRRLRAGLAEHLVDAGVLHESGYRVINGQLAASDATYELLPWTEVTIDSRNLKEHEQVEIWMTPEGVHEKFPELSIGWVGHSDRPVKVKLPRGKGRAAYWTKVDDEWTDAKFRHPIQTTADGPTEITLPPAP